MLLVALLTKLYVLMINFKSQLSCIEVQMQHMNLLKQFLKSISTVKNKKQTFSEKFNHN